MKDYIEYQACLERHGLKATHHVLIARLGEKKLSVFEGDKDVRTLPFSFGSLPVSCLENSLGTPIGLHEVAAKIGDGEPSRMIFRGRVATGECWHERADKGKDQRNFVTTRILRLRGLEPGLNAGPGIDSFDRFIYIHGTNHPEVFPQNISHGCLLLLDEDLIQLFDLAATGTHVFISPGNAL